MIAASVLKPDSPATPTGKPVLATGPDVPWERVEQFIGQFTHDIRNGLNALELQLTFLGEISTDPEAAAEVKQLRSTLGEITKQLQAVKLKTGSVTAHTMEYPAADFLEDLRERFERLHPADVARVRWEIPANGLTLLLDPELGLGALLELFGNALQFATPGSEIVLTTFPAPRGGASLALSQTLPQAPGLLPEHWGREPLHSTRRSAYGLGLFRARRVLEAQGASLDAVWSDGALTVTVTFASPSSAAS